MDINKINYDALLTTEEIIKITSEKIIPFHVKELRKELEARKQERIESNKKIYV